MTVPTIERTTSMIEEMRLETALTIEDMVVEVRTVDEDGWWICLVDRFGWLLMSNLGTLDDRFRIDEDSW